MNEQKTLLLVQDYLRSGKTLDELKAEHGINYHICNGKIGLTYHQIEARESDPLAQQCRGLVLRESTYDIVAYPLNRFFNLDQTGLIPKDFDWSTAAYESKLDGTLIIVYWDDAQNKWCCGTRSRPEADGNIDGGEQTFAGLVEIACQKMFDIDFQTFMNEFLPSYRGSFRHDCTFCFELTSPINRIVCKYDEIKLTLLAVRNKLTLEEEDPRPWATCVGLKTPQLYSFNNIQDMIEVISSWNPAEHEGVVVKDANFNRIKVKNPSYVAYNHARDSLSASIRGCVEVILLGKDDDIISMMPELIGNRIKKLKPIIQQVFQQTEQDYLELKSIDDMKTFALEAQKRIWPAALFALKRNKTPDLQTFIKTADKDKSRELPVPGMPQSKLDMMIELCKKIDPNCVDI